MAQFEVGDIDGQNRVGDLLILTIDEFVERMASCVYYRAREFLVLRESGERVSRRASKSRRREGTHVALADEGLLDALLLLGLGDHHHVGQRVLGPVLALQRGEVSRGGDGAAAEARTVGSQSSIIFTLTPMTPWRSITWRTAPSTYSFTGCPEETM